MIRRLFQSAVTACLVGVLLCMPVMAQTTDASSLPPTPDLPLLSRQAPGDVPPALMPPPPPTQLPVPAPVQPPSSQIPPGPTPAKTQAEAAPAPAAPALSSTAPVLEPPPPPSGFVLPASAQMTNSTTPVAVPPASPLMPPPPASMNAAPSPSTANPTAYQSSPLAMPSPPVVPMPAAPSMSPMSGGLQKIDARLAKQLKHLIWALAAIRELPDRPTNDGALRLLLGSGVDISRILGLAKFPVLPRFQARADETVVRNRSYDSWEYRFFGAFQTRLNGWVKPQALEVRADLKFDGRRKSWVRVTAVMTRLGQMTGRYTVQGADNWGRLWNLAVEMQGVQLHDDGLPSGGVLKISGADPAQKSMSLLLRFPCEVVGESKPPIDKRKTENRVSR